MYTYVHVSCIRMYVHVRTCTLYTARAYHACTFVCKCTYIHVYVQCTSSEKVCSVRMRIELWHYNTVNVPGECRALWGEPERSALHCSSGCRLGLDSQQREQASYARCTLHRSTTALKTCVFALGLKRLYRLLDYSIGISSNCIIAGDNDLTIARGARMTFDRP